jgi:hypothetical protein
VTWTWALILSTTLLGALTLGGAAFFTVAGFPVLAAPTMMLGGSLVIGIMALTWRLNPPRLLLSEMRRNADAACFLAYYDSVRYSYARPVPFRNALSGAAGYAAAIESSWPHVPTWYHGRRNPAEEYTRYQV